MAPFDNLRAMQEVVLGAFHKQHVSARETVTDLCTRLLAKDEALREAVKESSLLKKELGIRDQTLSDERKSTLMEIKLLKQSVQEKEKMLSEMDMEKKLAHDEIRVLKNMSKEREIFITEKIREMQTSTFAMNEATKKYNADMEDISRQKKLALEHLEQTRANCKYLDDYMTDIAKTIDQMSKEVQMLEENQKECESFLVGKNNPTLERQSIDSNALIESLCEQVGLLESQTIAYETKVCELEKIKTQLSTDNAVLRTHLQELQLQHTAQSRLVTKYQESSVCGTQTIDALQDSITTISAQNDLERDQFLKQIEALSAQILQNDQENLLKLQELNHQLIATQQTLQEKEIQLEEALKKSLSGTPPPPIPNLSPVLTATSNLIDTCPKSVTESDMCLSCQEAPFGFMVRCQKCKHQFHAGCVAAKRQKTLAGRSLSIFTCDQC